MLNEMKNDEVTITDKNDYMCKYTTADRLYSLFILFVGYLFFDLEFLSYSGAGTFLFTLIFISGTIIYIRKYNKQLLKGTVGFLLVFFFSSLYFLLFQSQLSHFFIKVLIMVYTILFIFRIGGNYYKKGLAEPYLFQFMDGILIVPFTNIHFPFQILKKTTSDDKEKKQLFPVIKGVLASLPLVIIICFLLSSADQQFANINNHLLKELNIDYSIIWKIILGIPFGCYLGGFVFGSLYGEDNYTSGNLLINSCRIGKRKFAPLTIYSFLTSINLVYLLFLVSQIPYISSALMMKIPKELVYSEYARKGFAEICVLTFLNLIIIFFAHRYYPLPKVSKSPKKLFSKSNIPLALKLLNIILCFFTLFLICVDLCKMYMYVNVYGLTFERFYAAAMMLFCGLILILISVRLFYNFHIQQSVFVGSTLFVLLLGYINPDKIIAQYNVETYLTKLHAFEKGERERSPYPIDYDYLDTLSDASIPYVYQLYLDDSISDEDKMYIVNIILDKRSDMFIFNTTRKEQIERYFSDHNLKPDQEYSFFTYGYNFRDFNITTYKADKIRVLVANKEYSKLMKQKD